VDRPADAAIIRIWQGFRLTPEGGVEAQGSGLLDEDVYLLGRVVGKAGYIARRNERLHVALPISATCPVQGTIFPSSKRWGLPIDVNIALELVLCADHNLDTDPRVHVIAPAAKPSGERFTL
jgi:hypothetical protein